MSVRKNERKESNLLYVQQAQQLCSHSFKLCSNPNNFPESILPNYIKQECLEILCAVRKTLSTATYEKQNTHRLIRFEMDALAHIDALYALLELVYNDSIYTITPESMEYWTGLVVALEDSIKKLGSITEQV